MTNETHNTEPTTCTLYPAAVDVTASTKQEVVLAVGREHRCT